ncbi:MAG: hypothetical protein WCT40_00210 [Candidatus Magasanikbacteria bacterium]|jgi:hypothetical protein
MPKDIDNIEIVEPPIEELTKKRGGFIRTCLTSCLLIVILFIGGVIALRLSLGPGPQSIKTLPADFPADIMVYDRDNIDNITFVSGRYKNRGVEIAAFFPKIILSPLIAHLSPANSPDSSANQSGSWRSMWNVATTPVSDQTDSIQIEWRDLDTSPGFLMSYYKKELQKKNFSIDVESTGKSFQQITFSRADGISGAFYASWTMGDKSRTTYAMLTVNASFQPIAATTTAP